MLTVAAGSFLSSCALVSGKRAGSRGPHLTSICVVSLSRSRSPKEPRGCVFGRRESGSRAWVLGKRCRNPVLKRCDECRKYSLMLANPGASTGWSSDCRETASQEAWFGSSYPPYNYVSTLAAPLGREPPNARLPCGAACRSTDPRDGRTGFSGPRGRGC